MKLAHALRRAVLICVSILVLSSCTGAQVQAWFAAPPRNQQITWQQGHDIAVNLNVWLARRHALARFLTAVSQQGAGGALAQLRACESSGNYRAHNPTGRYHGAYQFDLQTWGNHRGYPDAHMAPPAVQDARVREVYAQRGWAPWPRCGRGLGAP